MMPEHEKRDTGLRWNADVNAGHVLQALVLVIGGALALWTMSAKTDQTARELTIFQANMRDTVVGIRSEVREGISAIRTDIATIPDLRAQMMGFERRIAESDARDASFNTRLSAVERQAIENSVSLNNFRAASQQNLPGAPGVRTR